MTENITVNLLMVILLLAANGFFVAAEFALVKSRGLRVETLAAEGHHTAKLVFLIQQNLEAYLTTCQLGITMASLGLGWAGEPAVAALLEPLFHQLGLSDTALHICAFMVGFLVFSSLHIVFGERIPKALAIKKAEPVSLCIVYPLRVFYIVLYPLNWLLNAASQALLSLLSLNTTDASGAKTPSPSQEHSGLETDKAEMKTSLPDSDRPSIGHIMTPRTELKLLDLGATAEENLAVIRDSGHSHFPLINSKNSKEIAGIVLAQDLYTAMLANNPEPWNDLRRYARQSVIVPETQVMSRLFDIMRAERTPIVLVVNESGKLVGTITFEDLLVAIAGNIEGGVNAQEPDDAIIQLDDGRWEADGLTSLACAERTIGLGLPKDLHAYTLSALCLTILEDLPTVGMAIIQYGYRFTIESVENNRIDKLLIEKIYDCPLMIADASRRTSKQEP